jgi:hypothetical protein
MTPRVTLTHHHWSRNVDRESGLPPEIDGYPPDMLLSRRALAGTHATYLALTGAWAVASRSSFERVTGRKQDFWLVRLVGGLALATGLSLGVSVVRGARTPEARVLAVASSAAFGAGDLYAARGYSRIYVMDALLQLLFAHAWLVPWEPEGKSAGPRQPATRT